MACDVVDHIINTIFHMYLNLNGRNNVNVIDVFDFQCKRMVVIYQYIQGCFYNTSYKIDCTPLIYAQIFKFVYFNTCIGFFVLKGLDH